MSLPTLPNPSNFLGVALVITRTHEGPRFVFHYPPNISPVQGSRAGERADDDYDDDDVFGDGAARPSGGFGDAWSSPVSAAELARWNHDDHLFTETGAQIVPWEHVAGFPTKALEAILTPARAYHKKLFQVSLDPIYCVSYPIYVSQSGTWRKKKKKKKNEKRPRKDDDDDEVGPLDTDHPAAGASDVGAATDAETPEARDRPADEGEEKAAEDKASSMRMFNLVFILNPKRHEVKELVDTMHSHIIKKVNKVYRYAQQRSDFVWKESKKILALKEKAREDRTSMSTLWNEILAASSLAASMQDVYDAVSQNKIAALQLDTPEGAVTHSVQIPMPFHVSDLPRDDEAAARGLWLTTANSFVHDGDAGGDGPGYLDRNFALLLTDDDKKIVAELQADPDETTLAMVEFVKHSRPTLSFHQVAQQPNNVLTLGQVRKYAQHFIFWRRAIAVPPLHARDTYILSPNCDLPHLPRASAQWARDFPLAPPLPDFLAVLSTAPRPYKAVCPAKSYRPDYLRMLAWLLRGGWVTQLCTFAYVVVWPEVLYEVEYGLEAEELARARKAQQAAADEHDAAAGRKGSHESRDDAATAASTASAEHKRATSEPSEAGDAAAAAASPPSLPATASTLSSGSRDAAALSVATAHPNNSTGSLPGRKPTPTPAEQAAQRARLERIADKAARDLAEKATAHARRVPPATTARPSTNRAPHLAHLAPHLIPDARNPSGRESLYLAAIGRRLRARGSPGPPAGSGAAGAAGPGKRGAKDGARDAGPRAKRPAAAAAAAARSWDDRVADSWPLFWRYFDGRSALERVALREDMKRKDVWNLLTAMSEYLLCVRHW